jgi:hypothetical protein
MSFVSILRQGDTVFKRQPAFQEREICKRQQGVWAGEKAGVYQIYCTAIKYSKMHCEKGKIFHFRAGGTFLLLSMI